MRRLTDNSLVHICQSPVLALGFPIRKDSQSSSNQLRISTSLKLERITCGCQLPNTIRHLEPVVGEIKSFGAPPTGKRQITAVNKGDVFILLLRHAADDVSWICLVFDIFSFIQFVYN